MNPSVCLALAEHSTQEPANSLYVVGLDPPTLSTLSPLLYLLAQSHSPRLVLALRQQDPLPEWITHLIYLGPSLHIAGQGVKADVLRDLGEAIKKAAPLDDILRPAHLPRSMVEIGRKLTPTGIHYPGGESVTNYEQLTGEQLAHLQNMRVNSPEYDRAKAKYEGGDRSYLVLRRLGMEPDAEHCKWYSLEGSKKKDDKAPIIGEPLVEMNGVTVEYGDKKVLGHWTQIVDGQPKDGMWWQICRGQRWGVFGPNGKHPQLENSPSRRSRTFSRLTMRRIWEDNTPVTHVLRSSTDILSSHKDFWPITTAEPRSARNLDL